MKIPVLKNNGLTRLLLLLLVSVLSLGTALGQDASPGTVTFNSQSYRFAEDDGRVTVELQRSGGSAGAITVKLEARSVSERATAVQGRDYRLDSDSVSWRSGESGTKSFGLTMLQDDDGQEGDEAFDLLITDLGGAGAGKITRTRIVIADSPPIVRNAGEVNFEKANWEIREDGDFINIAVLRSGGSDGVAEVGYSLGGNQDTATPGEDYTRVSGTLRWQDGEDGPKTFSVKVLQDQDGNEGRETVGLFLTKPVGATTGNTPSATLTIIDVPPATGLVEFAQSSYQFSESDGEAVLILKRVNGDAGVAEAFIGYGGSGDSAVEGEDYTEGTTTVRWADGDSADKRITVPLKTDSLVEEDESFSVFLDDVAGADFGQRSSSTVTIKDSTVLPRPGVISFRNATHTSAENAGDIKFDVLRSDGSDGAVSVAYRIGASGDTATADADYKSGSGTLRWADGDSSAKQITLSLLADQQREADEFVSIVLSSPEGGATLGDPDSARITIQDASSAGTLSFSSGSYTVNESDGSLSIGIRRSGGSAGQVSVKVRSGADDDSASSGADYEPLEQTLSWAEGDTGEKSVTLTVREDTLVEGDEFLTLSLLDVSGGAQLSDPRSASVKIVNTTPVKNGTLGIEQASYTVAEAAGTLQVRVLRASGTDGAVSVNYSLGASGDTALAGEDYVAASGVLNWADGDNTAKTIPIEIIYGAEAEPLESFTLLLAQPSGGATLGSIASATISIEDEMTEDFPALLEIISGDQQSGFPGDMLEPFVLSVKEQGDLAAARDVSWRVEPAGAGRLIDGQVTRSDDAGLARNSLEILEGGVITVIATVGEQSVASRADDDTPNTVRFTVNAGFAGTADLTPNQRAVGGALDKACLALENKTERSAAEADLLATCDKLQAGTAGDIKSGLNRLQPEEVFAIGTLSLDTADLQVTNVQSRINAIRLGSHGFDLSGLELQLYGQTIPGYVSNAILDAVNGGGAGDDAGEPSRFGAFVNGTVSVGKLDRSDREMGLDFDNQSVTAGVDYRINDSVVVGGSLGVTRHQGDYSSEGGGIELKSTSLSAFATWYDEDDIYVDAILHYGSSKFDIERRINLDGEAAQFARGKPDATEFALSLGAGLEYASGSWTYGPYGRLSFSSVDVDAYDESASDPQSPGFGSVLSVRSQSIDSSSIVLGGHVSRAISTAGGVYLPQARLELEHRFSDSAREVEASFRYDPEKNLFAIDSENVDTDYLNLGLGGSAVFRNGRSAFVFYETRLGQDRLTQNWFKVGVRFEF